MDLTAVVLLKRLGKIVPVVEARRRIAEGDTGHAPAKIASQHELIYVPSFVYTESEDYLGQLEPEVEGEEWDFLRAGCATSLPGEGGGPAQ